jgi:hypothetical protein
MALIALNLFSFHTKAPAPVLVLDVGVTALGSTKSELSTIRVRSPKLGPCWVFVEVDLMVA